MSMYYIYGFPISDELFHHGIIGQKCGIRRYQNSDGSLTNEGKKRYGPTKEELKEARKRKSIERGEKLIAKGRTKRGAIGRGVGRQAGILLGHLALASIAAASIVKMSELTDPNNEAALLKIMKGASATDAILTTAGLGLTVANVGKTIRQYKDISRAKKNSEQT